MHMRVVFAAMVGLQHFGRHTGTDLTSVIDFERQAFKVWGGVKVVIEKYVVLVPVIQSHCIRSCD